MTSPYVSRAARLWKKLGWNGSGVGSTGLNARLWAEHFIPVESRHSHGGNLASPLAKYKSGARVTSTQASVRYILRSA
jgi:hypothetical protein